MCEYRNFSKLFKIIQEEKSNDICIADEVEYVVDRLITYKREWYRSIKGNYLNECVSSDTGEFFSYMQIFPTTDNKIQSNNQIVTIYYI